ncbi:hypothetical protein K8S19_04570 [bacterium]|nr:hypothetical protein [bacterium]
MNNQKSFKAWFSKNRKTLLVILGTWLLAIIWFILIYKLNNLNPTVNSDPAMPWKSIPSKLIGISHVIQNVGIYNNFLRHPVPGPSIPFLYFNFITFFSGFIYYSAYLIKSRRSNRPVNPSHFMAILLFCSSCLILTQIIITPAAIHAWHFFCLYPSLLLFAILSWIHILHAIKEHIIFHKSLSSLLIGGMILYGIFINTIVHKKIKNVAPQTKNWERIFSTTTNDAFLAYLKDHPQIYFHFLDWGMHTLAITLLAETRFHETFNFPNELSGVSINTGDYFVTHSPEASAFPKIRSVFFNYLNQFGLDYTLDHKIVDTDGLTVFEFWKINKSAAVGTPIFNLHDSPLDLFQGHACTINASLHKKTLEINTHDIDPVVLLPKFHFPSSAHDYIVQVEIHSSTTTLFRLFPQTVQQPHYGFNLSTRIIPGNNHLFFLLPNHELIGRLRMDPGEKPGRYVFKSISVSRIKPK